jgi:hypothetical protein
MLPFNDVELDQPSAALVFVLDAYQLREVAVMRASAMKLP